MEHRRGVCQDFAHVALAGLRGREETAARTPWWLLALRLLAAGLLVLGLARPVLDAAAGLEIIAGIMDS